MCIILCDVYNIVCDRYAMLGVPDVGVGTNQQPHSSLFSTDYQSIYSPLVTTTHLLWSYLTGASQGDEDFFSQKTFLTFLTQSRKIHIRMHF